MPDKTTATVNVPDGMTPEKLMELINRYEQGRLSSDTYRKARQAAISELIAAHTDEFEQLKRKHGIKAKA